MSTQTQPELHVNTTETVQDFILERLTQMGRSQRWFADQVGMSQAQLNVWLRGRPCSARWIIERSTKFAATLGCSEEEIINRIPSSTERRSRPTDPQPLNKNILRALAEDQDPTDELLDMLQRVQEEVGAELSYEACAELIKVSKTTSAT